MANTPNHGYNVPAKGAQDWHKPLNDNFEAFDTDIEIRDTAANRSNYNPKAGAKFLATDTEEVFLGNGSSWDRLRSTGKTPTFSELNPNGKFLGIGRPTALGEGEVLGLNVEGSKGDYGGMTINTTQSEGRPYYAYLDQGTPEAWHWYDAGDNTWKLYNNGQFALGLTDKKYLGVGTTNPGLPLDVVGQDNWNLDSGDGDVRIGNTNYRLAIGVALSGAGAGACNLRAKGGIKRLNLGAGTSGHTVQIDESAVQVNGDFNVSGNKNFTQTVDTDGGEKEVVYTATESGTPYTEASGVVELQDGRAEVDLPDHFGWVTDEDEPVMVQVTPHACEAVRPQVTERSPDRIVVKDFADADNYEVSYTVRGTRKGHADKEVVREPTESTNNGASAPADD